MDSMARISNLSRRRNSNNLTVTYGAQKFMRVDPYITLAKALERAGLTAQRTPPTS